MLRKLSSAGYVRCVVRLAQPQTLKSCGFITNHVRLECHTTAFRHQIRFLSTDLPDVDTNKLTQLGKQYFDNNKYSEAEAALRKAAANNDSEAQFQLGLLLTTPTPLSKDAIPAAVSSTAAEVKDEIKKLRKESLMAKQVQSGSVAAFQKALNKRKDQQGNSQLDSIKVEHSTAKQRKGIEIAGQAREKEGLVWMKAAAEQGHTNAMCYLGNHLLATAQTQLNELAVQDMPVQSVHKSKEQACKQIAEAISHYERAALLNNATAAFNLGVLYYDGITCDMPPATVMQKPNSENPVSNAHSAATTSAPPEITVSKVSNRQKRQEAQDEAAAAQSKPVKVDIVCVDLARSLLYFEQAAALHEPTAALWCGYCYANEEGGVESHEVSGGKALSYLTAAAQHPDTSAKAHFYLSQIYYSGCKGTERSGADAVALNIGMFVQHLRQAVAGHDEDALKCLADLHLQYVGLPSAEQSEVDSSEEADTSKILVLLNDDLHAAAEASACHHEGCGHDHHNHQHHDHHHHHHHDHKQDHQHEHQADKHLRRAVVLFEQASAAGQATATLTLGALTYQGVIHSTAGVADKRRAFELYNLAAEQGSLDAWRNLASMYYLGDGVPKSEVTAREIMKVMFGKKPSTI